MENELLIPTILVVALTSLCIYGMISKKVILMRWGLFIWALIAIAANLGEFFVNAASTMVVVLFMCQAILMAPFWSEPFDAANKAAYLAAKRLTLILVTINIFFCAIGFVEMEWGSDQPASIPIHVCHGIVAAIGLMMFSRFMSGAVEVK